VAAIVRPGGEEWRLATLRDEVELREVELRDEDAAGRSVDAFRPEWIFHLAAHNYWDKRLQPHLDTNLVATATLLRAGALAGCEAFVHAGTSLEYGFKDHAPSEGELPEPNTAYGLAKAAATMLCTEAGRTTGMRTVTLRLYSVYGAYEHPRRLIPNLIVHGMRGELPALTDPLTQRDFVAVADAVEAFVLAAAAENGDSGIVYNVGSGEATSLAELVELTRRQLGIDAQPVWGSLQSHPWDTSVWVADSAKIRTDLGWEPRRDLETGFGETVEWLSAEPTVWEAYGVTSASPVGRP
jgi:dolichol-phosphate mannosyltransferase